MDPVPQPSLRRTPVQQRSAERLARILDACAELLDEAGYEQLSTRAVAQRAGVPIGSVYRFFGNKRAMADALAHRNLDRYAERITARLAATGPVDAYSAIDGVLDEYIAMKRTVPGFALIDFGVPAPTADERSGDDTGGNAGVDSGADPGVDPGANHLVADRLCGLLAAHLGRTADEALHRKVLVGVEAADALLQLAFRTAPSGDPALIAETRELLYAYLAPSLT
ncbi:TetR/AcrR family transcriptional regulator [Streptomyces sp. P9(2023)]|uniref:TetR/AcrR family transcriptional regulator n=1 Tax=Streptomyces sp. P9(2023) TaxID=3064394 RepID=UPI0028F43DA6|nr:TetR/AcrR family transcriptional regulator [Streptomyces sp. P9(2023)]MDT9691602.1 TetR/AcrR family transcriptional regulator [Streptomyces sp. P9(2023)]